MRFAKNRLITGTLILTAASFISRIFGFFYRMFLSQTFGEESMGIYQLISPVIALSYSFAIAGIETSISKYIAECNCEKKESSKVHVLQIGVLLSVGLSILTGFIIFEYAEPISVLLLMEKRCTSLVRIYAISMPLAAIHSCINGYYYGLKKTAVPAVSQLIEQMVRVGSVYLICEIIFQMDKTPSISVAAIGLVAGELASTLTCIISMRLFSKKDLLTSTDGTFSNSEILNGILKMALPLTLNRIVLNLFHSVESVYIPNRLLLFGFSHKDALSLYGVLTGMAFPLIFAPSTLTNSLSVLLLPYVSEAESMNRTNRIVSAFRKCLTGCILLGVICGIIFFLFGDFFGALLFHSERAGAFIVSLSYICPFLYLGGVLSSILHGLGRAGCVFWLQLISLLIRLLFVFIAIPLIGIQGYLIGILVSQLVFCILIFIALKDYIYYNRNVL